MISKNLFRDLVIEDRKRRLWPIALSILANFFALPVFAAIMINTFQMRLGSGLTTLAEARNAFFYSVVSEGNIPVLLIAGLLALINGLNGMTYLHSRAKTDLYYGLPVKRSEIFNAAFLNGILFFAIPYVIGMAITVVFGYIRGYFIPAFLPEVLLAIVLVLIMYISNYSLVVFAAVICGNTVVSIFMAMIMLFYVPLCRFTSYAYGYHFLVNYYYAGGDGWRFLSPALAFIWMTSSRISMVDSGADPKYFQLVITAAIVMALLALLFYALSVFLVAKRPSESAGKAIAFSWMKPVIKVLLMVVGAMLFAMLMQEVSGNMNYGWMIFGYIIGVLLIQAVTEIVFEFDFKAIARHPVSLVVGAVLTAALMLGFFFDITGYDSYIPRAEDVVSSAVCGYGLQDGIDYIDERGNYIDQMTYREDNMFLADTEDVIDLAKIGVERSDRIHDLRIGRLNKADLTKETEDYEGTTILVIFRMKNNSKIYRNYNINMHSDEALDIYGRIYETNEYKEGVYQALKADTGDMKRVFAFNGFEYKEMKVDDEQKDRLMDYYRLDQMEQDIDSLLNETPLCMVTATNSSRKDWRYDGREISFYVYPSFERCVKFLKEQGVETERDISKVDYLTINGYSDNEEWVSNIYDDRAQIEEIMSMSQPQIFCFMNNALKETRDEKLDSIYIDVTLKENENSSDMDSFIFLNNDIPDYVKF